MENASKALLIAGAVLIVILIIGVGMAIYTGAKGNIDSAMASLSSDQIQQFNSKFEKYEGAQKGSQIKTLLNEIAANNNNYTSGQEGYVQVSRGTGTTSNFGTNELSTQRTAINSATTYTVSFKYGTTGLVNEVNINP